MIPDHLVQKAIIAKIKSFSAITSLLNSVNEVREDQWQGEDFGYPAIRVDLGEQIPLGNGIRTKISLVTFIIIVQDTEPSSGRINRIANQVTTNFFNAQIYGTDENNVANYFKLIRIDLLSSGKALRTEDKLWEKELIFQSEGHLLA